MGKRCSVPNWCDPGRRCPTLAVQAERLAWVTALSLVLTAAACKQYRVASNDGGDGPPTDGGGSIDSGSKATGGMVAGAGGGTGSGGGEAAKGELAEAASAAARRAEAEPAEAEPAEAEPAEAEPAEAEPAEAEPAEAEPAEAEPAEAEPAEAEPAVSAGSEAIARAGREALFAATGAAIRAVTSWGRSVRAPPVPRAAPQANGVPARSSPRRQTPATSATTPLATASRTPDVSATDFHRPPTTPTRATTTRRCPAS